MCQGCQGSVGVTVHFPLLELQVTYSMPELGAAGLRRGQSRFVWPWAPARLALPRAVQCQLSLAQWEATPCLLHQPQPHSCTTKSSSRPAAAGPRAVPWPWGAAHPQQCPAHTGAAGWEGVKGFCHSKRDSNTQESSYCKAKAEPEQCHPPAETGILRRLNILLLQNQCFHSMLRIP